MTTSPRRLDKIDTMPLQDSSTAHHGPPSPAVLRRASSAPEMERKLRTALAIEHQRRVVAEGRAQQIASLSPVEQAMLAAWARTARLLHAPKPRCFFCGGPLFWMCIVPWILCVAFTGGSPLVLVACEDPRYPTPVSSSSVDDRPYGGVAVRLFMAEQTHTPLTPVARRKLMRLLLDRGASPHAIRNAHRVTDDARTILRQYYSIVVHLNAFGTARTCPNPARLSAIDLVPTIASYVI